MAIDEEQGSVLDKSSSELVADVLEDRRKKRMEKEQAALEKQLQEEAEKKARYEQKLKEVKEANARNRRRHLPAIVMLTAGACVSITMMLMHYEAVRMLRILLIVLIIFYLIGCLMKWMFEKFDEELQRAEADDGEVIEKPRTDTKEADEEDA